MFPLCSWVCFPSSKVSPLILGVSTLFLGAVRESAAREAAAKRAARDATVREAAANRAAREENNVTKDYDSVVLIPEKV